MEKLLWTEGIVYSYEEHVPVLNRVSAAFYRGEKVAVIGSNAVSYTHLTLPTNREV